MNDNRKFLAIKKYFLLLLESGLPLLIISKILAISESTANLYFKKVKESKDFEGKILTISKSYKFLFKVYSNLISSNHHTAYGCLTIDLTNNLRNVLDEFLKTREIHGDVDMARRVMKRYATVDFDENISDVYRNLIKRVYLNESDLIDFDFSSGIVVDFFHLVKSGEIELPENITSLDVYVSMVVDKIIDELYNNNRENVAPFIPVSFVSVLKKEIAMKLSFEEAALIGLYFGISYKSEYCKSSSEPLSFGEIKANYPIVFKLTRERLRQILERSIRKLNNNRMRGYFSSVYNALSQRLVLEKEIIDDNDTWKKRFNELTQNSTDTKIIENYVNSKFTEEQVVFLSKNLIEFDISVRLLGSLKYKNLSFVYESLILTEKELLQIRNFGRKSLNELKTLAEEKGLTIELNLTDVEKNYFKKISLL